MAFESDVVGTGCLQALVEVSDVDQVLPFGEEPHRTSIRCLSRNQYTDHRVGSIG